MQSSCTVFLSILSCSLYAGAAGLGRTTITGKQAFSGRGRYSKHAEAVQAATSYLGLPAVVIMDAKRLLASLTQDYWKEYPRITNSTVAALVYLAARDNRTPLTLKMAARAVQTDALAVGKEFK